MRFILFTIMAFTFFSFVQASSAQEVSETPYDEYIDNLTGMLFKLVDIDEDTKVYIGVYEVTQSQWIKILKQNPSNFKRNIENPVETVSIPEIQKFIDTYRNKTNISYRLPSYYEWSEAAGEFSYDEDEDGNESVCLMENLYDNDSKNLNFFGNKSFACSDGFAYTAPVGSFESNGNGFYDMYGNVSEWCCDTYIKDNQDEKPFTESYCDKFQKASKLAVAGGNFTYGPNEMKTIVKNESIHKKFGGLGFRLAIDAEISEDGSYQPKAVK